MHALRLVVIEKSDFVVRSKRIVRNRRADLDIVRRHLEVGSLNVKSTR